MSQKKRGAERETGEPNPEDRTPSEADREEDLDAVQAHLFLDGDMTDAEEQIFMARLAREPRLAEVLEHVGHDTATLRMLLTKRRFADQDTCRRIVALFPTYRSGRTTPEETAEISRHLVLCVLCARALDAGDTATPSTWDRMRRSFIRVIARGQPWVVVVALMLLGAGFAVGWFVRGV